MSNHSSPWNKGLTKNSSEIVRISSEKMAKTITGRKKGPLSKEHKEKISRGRVLFLKEHPDQIPYKLYHSSKDSWPERIFQKELEKRNIKSWIHNYMAGIYEYDFAFPIQRLDIEIDGSTHNSEKVKKIDMNRDKWSVSEGWKVLRFKASHVKNSVESCADIVIEELKQSKHSQKDIDESFRLLKRQLDKTHKEKIEEKRKQLSEKKIELKNKKIEAKRQEKILKDQLKDKEKILLKDKRESIMKDVNLHKRGWVTLLSKKWGVSHTHVRRIMKHYFLDR